MNAFDEQVLKRLRELCIANAGEEWRSRLLSAKHAADSGDNACAGSFGAQNCHVARSLGVSTSRSLRALKRLEAKGFVFAFLHGYKKGDPLRRWPVGLAQELYSAMTQENNLNEVAV